VHSPDLSNKDFLVVNAFAKEPYGGNPAGVFFRADGLNDAAMQNIARQLNLVETVFVLPPEGDADFRLRYFTPLGEIPVAGHPSIAAWFALLHENIVDTRKRTQFVQANKAGTQQIQIENSENGKPVITMQQPEPQFLKAKCDTAQVASVFGISVDDINTELPLEAVDTGLGHLIVPLKSLDALMRVKRQIEPLRSLCQSLKIREAQLFCFETIEKTADMHTRNLCPREGLEDPACGVGNGALAAYLAKFFQPNETAIKLQIEQGTIVNMPATIHTRTNRDNQNIRVFVGGSAVAMVRGQILV
jgi:trans-2,3-dihydro-3-hydroxyanthranilate isomerase